MYNRYIPTDGFRPVEPEPGRENRRQRQGRGGLFDQLFSLFGGKNGGCFGLEKVDKGDILLVLVLIYLFQESEDEEWLIILALVLLMGLG